MKDAGFKTLHIDKRSKTGANRLSVIVLDILCKVCEGPILVDTNKPIKKRESRKCCSRQCAKAYIRIMKLRRS